MRKDSQILVVFLAMTIALVGCGGDGREDPILRLSAEESLIQGKSLMEGEKYYQARQYLTHAFEVEPNSASGREALMLVADAHFLEGGSANFIKSEAKYRDFQNRFPTSDRSAYVQFQIASSLAGRIRKPDRDQTISRDALDAYQDLLRLFPSSEYTVEAHQQIAVVRNTLAAAEYQVGRYNFRRGRFAKCGAICYLAAITRLQRVVDEYPAYQEKDRVHYYLALCHLELGQEEKAEETLAILRESYSESGYAEDVEGQRKSIAKRRAKLLAKQAARLKKRQG